jgi:hypothetical protein
MLYRFMGGFTDVIMLSLSLFYVFIYLTRLGELELDARAHSGDMAAICTRTARLSAV